MHLDDLRYKTILEWREKIGQYREQVGNLNKLKQSGENIRGYVDKGKEAVGDQLERGKEAVEDIDYPYLKAGLGAGTAYMLGSHLRDRKHGRSPHQEKPEQAEDLVDAMPRHLR